MTIPPAKYPPGAAFTPKRALLYLRVSTPGQMNTDYDPEGISIPTQRVKCSERAISLGAEIVDEFIEPGRSGTTIDGRKEFQRMMAYIRLHKDIDYVIVFNRARLFRNSVDAAITKRELKQLGCTIISILDYTEDTPVGDLVATILDGVNEYQSKSQGADIALKMAGKVERGGSVARAQLGYLNVRETIDGREIRTIAVDPERAPLVLMGFELFATGTYGYDTLLEALTDAGLRSRPTRKHPAGAPISRHKLGQMLQDRFYIGYVNIKGKEYPGRHEPIVPRDLFDRVQEIIAERGGGEGTRQRRHSHYLKGSLWCARSGHRVWYVPGRSKTGEVYFYFMCSGRPKHQCDLPYLKVDQVERAVADNYASITLAADLRAKITTAMRAAVTDSEATDSLMRASLTKQLAALDVKIDALLELVGDPNWPTDRLSVKMTERREERAKLQRQLDQLAAPNLDEGHSALTSLLELLGDASRLYRLAGTGARKVLNQVFFTRIYLDALDGVAVVASDEPTDIVRPLVEFQRNPHGVTAAGQRSGGTAEISDTAAKITPTTLLTTALAGGSSGKTAMVGAVEALSRPSLPVRRLLDLAGQWSPATIDDLPPVPTYRTARQLSPDELDALVIAYQAGGTVYELAAQFGINRKTVGKHLRARGVDTTPPGIRPEDVEAAIKLYRAGHSLASIAARFGTSAGTVHTRLLRAGVAMRKPWEQGHRAPARGPCIHSPLSR